MGNTLIVVKRNDTRTPSVYQQIPLDRAKWQGLIRRGAGEYEAKKNHRSLVEMSSAKNQT